MRGCMREHGAPAMDPGCGEGVAQGGWGVARFRLGQKPEECGSFIAPTSANFNPQDNEAASPVLEEFWVGSFLQWLARAHEQCLKERCKIIHPASSGRPRQIFTEILPPVWVA